jgi:hypothetical protein
MEKIVRMYCTATVWAGHQFLDVEVTPEKAF